MEVPGLRLASRPALLLIATLQQTLSHGNAARQVGLRPGEFAIKSPTKVVSLEALLVLLHHGLVNAIAGMTITGIGTEIVTVIVIVTVTATLITITTKEDTARWARQCPHGNSSRGSNITTSHRTNRRSIQRQELTTVMPDMLATAVMLRLRAWVHHPAFRRLVLDLLLPRVLLVA